MTTIPATGSSTGTSSGATAAAKTGTSSVDYNAFLQLLVQEMKNQDPTSPSDPTQYLGQIASFSNVEQGVQTNTKLASLLTTSALTQAEISIGRTATSADGTTQGVIRAVTIASDGTTQALLTNGKTLTLDSSVVISNS